MPKVLPYNRSVVFKLLIESADSISRLPVVKGSMGIRVFEGMEYTVADSVISDGNDLEINNIGAGIGIVSTQNYTLTITVGGVVGPEMKCAGLFVFTGPADKIVIKQTMQGTPVRLKYVKA